MELMLFKPKFPFDLKFFSAKTFALVWNRSWTLIFFQTWMQEQKQIQFYWILTQARLTYLVYFVAKPIPGVINPINIHFQ